MVRESVGCGAVNEQLVSSLINNQFPEYSALTIHHVESAGTDNDMYRLGDELVVRLPRIDWAENQVHKEQRWLPQFVDALPLPIPAPVAMGLPAEGFDRHWSIYRWLHGNDAFDAPIVDLYEAAVLLGRFGSALRRIDATDGPPSFRGSPLSLQQEDVLAAIRDLGAAGIVDPDAARGAWQRIIALPQWDKPPVWTHSDLLPGNLLTQAGRLSAVIDFGGVGVGDPACDMMVAWTVLTEAERNVFREHSDVDEATWERGRGWALGFGLMAFHYHHETNPVLAAVGRRSLQESLAEFAS